MALPTSRDETLVDAGPLAFTLGNSLQDQIINAQHGLEWLVLGGSMVEGEVALSGTDLFNIFSSPGSAIVTATASIKGHFTPPLLAGHVIRAALVDVYHGIAGNKITMEMFDQDPTSDIGMVAVSSGGWGTDVSTGTISTFDQISISGSDLTTSLTRRYSLQLRCEDGTRILQVRFQIIKLT